MSVVSTAIAGMHSYQTHYPNSFHKSDLQPRFTQKNNLWRLPSSLLSFQLNSINVEIKQNSENPSTPEQVKISVQKFSVTNPETPFMTDRPKTFAKESLNAKPPFTDGDGNNKGIAKYKSKSVRVNPNSPRAAALKLSRYERRKKHFMNSNWNDLNLLAQKLDSCQSTEEAVFEFLDSVEFLPFPKDAVILIKMIRDSEKAYYLMQWLSQKEEFEMNLIVYNVAMKAVGRGRQWDRIEKLLKEMLDRQIEPNIATCLIALNCASRCNVFHNAAEWFGTMQQTFCLPDEVVYATMVEAHSKSGQVQEALNLFERGRANGWVPDIRTFGTILKIHILAGDADAVFRVFGEMKTLGVKPDLTTSNMLLRYLAEAENPVAAKLLFKEMTNAGVIPDLKTLNYLMRVYSKAKHWATDALKLWKRVNKEGWMKNISFYNTLLRICAQSGLMEQAATIFEEMIRSDTCQPDCWSYISMTEIYAKRHRIKEVDITFSTMMKAGGKPTVFTCTCLIQCYVKAKRFDDVVKIFSLLLAKGISPDDKLCGSLLSALKLSENEEFDKVFECIETANPKLGVVVKMLQQENVCLADFQKEIKTFFNHTSYGRYFCNCLIDLCYKFHFQERARYLLHLGTILGFYKNLSYKTTSEWFLNLHGLPLNSALTAFDCWIRSLLKSLEDGEEIPPLLGIQTGVQTKYQASLEQDLSTFFESYLKKSNSPFEKNTERAGWFLATHDAAISWLESRDSSILVTI